jgi:antirestriction protein ArdC
MALDVYQRINALILEQLENGTVPWHKPWSFGEAGAPQNLISRKAYRGINTFLLACQPYESPFWLTYRQAKQLSGHVRKGEKSAPVVFWKWLEKPDPDTGEAKRIPLLRYYSVFNVTQCDLPNDKVPELPGAMDNDFEPIAACEQLVESLQNPPAVHHDAAAAYYEPATDTIHLPMHQRFDSPEVYYATLLHELTHSTGHESRLNRSGITDVAAFASQSYSKEELIAEMGAAYLCGHTGSENSTLENSAAYIAGWLRRLRGDKKLVVQAAANAQKAADFVLNRTFDEAVLASV